MKPDNPLTTFVVHDLDSPLVELVTGVQFPGRTLVEAHGADGLLIEVLLEVEDRRPVVSRVTVGRSEGGAPLDAASLGLPLGRIFDQVIAQVAATVARSQASAKVPFGTMFQWPSDTGARAVAARRRHQPASDTELKQVAQIVRSNKYDPRKQVARELPVSERTASRWIAEARRRGLITEEEDGK